MRRAAIIFLLGLALGIMGYAGLYSARLGQTHHVANLEHPELAWLKTEFALSDQDFARIQTLHEQYLPECARMCVRIAQANSALESLILKTNRVTPEISAKLTEIGNLRQECQTKMLAHFYAVSQAMAPEQGRRYLEQMQKLTSLSNRRDHSLAMHSANGH